MELEEAKEKARKTIEKLSYTEEEKLTMTRGMILLADILEGDWSL